MLAQKPAQGSACPAIAILGSHSGKIGTEENSIAMTPTPGGIIQLATFPGIITHEWAHKIFCDLFGVRVHNVAYLKPASIFSMRNDPLGYVIHADPDTFLQTFFISTGPLVVNSLATVFLACLATQVAEGIAAQLALLWLAISVGAHAFPSEQDARNVLNRSQRHIANNESCVHYLSYLFFGLVWMANKLRRWGADLIYAVFLVGVSAHL